MPNLNDFHAFNSTSGGSGGGSGFGCGALVIGFILFHRKNKGEHTVRPLLNFAHSCKADRKVNLATK